MTMEGSIVVSARTQDCWMCKLVIHHDDLVVRVRRYLNSPKGNYVSAIICLDCGIAIADAAAEFVEARR